jgi:hypothetical protein
MEAFIVALSIVALGYVLKEFCKIREPLILLFVTGFLIHIMYDLLGLNKYYCKICAGCK